MSSTIGLSAVAFYAALSLVVSLAVPANLASETTCQPTDMRALPGRLDKIEVLNSNSPEVVQTPGILVSTLSPDDKTTPAAHLNHSFSGRFDIFAHHIAKSDATGDLTTLHLGILLYNPGNYPAKVDLLEGASYVSQPDAPFVALPSAIDNAAGDIYAGPGDRVTNDVLRGKLQRESFPASVEVPARGYALVASLPIPVKGLTPPLNGRSALLHLSASSSVQAATLAMFAKKNEDGTERMPSLEEWKELAIGGQLAGPREKSASAPDATGPIIYGRVSGVGVGSTWTARLSDNNGKSSQLKLAPIGQSISFPISSVTGGTFGTGQIHSAKLLLREPDTAYAAHGNYGIKYDITIPLVNNERTDVMALIRLQTPIKKDSNEGKLTFFKEPSPRVFFRGTVKSSYIDSQQIRHEKFTHLVQHQGEQGIPLVGQYLKPKERRTVHLEFYYPPDATPPQVVTIESTDPAQIDD